MIDAGHGILLCCLPCYTDIFNNFLLLVADENPYLKINGGKIGLKSYES